ncbi:MAG: sodium-dependent transporter, partial [Alphaproteobacteria bacterium]
TGSAVGLGNIWRFPYMAGENGGGAFLVVYLALVFTIGASVMLSEFVIGRAAESSPVGALRKLKGGAWPAVGFLGVAAGFIILSVYSVVAGWTLAYIVKSATGLLAISEPEALAASFESFIGDPIQPLIYHGIFVVLTVGVVTAGVHKGIERTCQLLLPLLFVILIVLAVRSLTLPGAMEGVSFYLTPDFSRIDAGLINAALTQAFFSLSLGLGAMITYGSYLSHEENLPSAALWVVFCDAMVAVTAGLVIMPAVFAFSFDPTEGPGLVFITLPAIFGQMPIGAVFSTLFFVLLFIAALTSAVSLLEVVTAYFVDERGKDRKPAAIMVGFAIFLVGIPASLSLGPWSDITIFGMTIFDLMDFVTANLLLPLGGIAISLFVGWAIYPRALEEATSKGMHPFIWAAPWRFISRYVAPIAIAWILIAGLRG